MLEQILPLLVTADEDTLYKLLGLVGRKRRRLFLDKIEETVKGRSDLLKGTTQEVKDGVIEKFNKILAHYGKGIKD